MSQVVHLGLGVAGIIDLLGAVEFGQHVALVGLSAVGN